jgi:aldehyde:ferredoxin oxidoreductase
LEFGGYSGNILRIDLSTQTSRREPLKRYDVERFVGGRGLGCYYLFKEVDHRVEPLSPANKLFLTSGPLTGTFVPTSTRFVVTTKSPLTGIYCFSVSSGEFGPMMKRAGYDMIILEGRAAKPTYLMIDDDKVVFRDAASLWGLPTFETARVLRESHGYAYSTIQIGPAGERVVNLAAIITDDRRAAGRGGVGAVMGSKNLKAIMIKGGGEIPIADRVAYDKVLREAFSAIAAQRGPWKDFPSTGTQSGVMKNQGWGILPTNNWRDSVFEHAAEISYPKLREKLVLRDKGCPRCPVCCTKLTLVQEGPYAGASTDGPEYETIYAFGSACGVGKPEPIVAADMMCDDFGLDTMSTGLSIAWAMENFERGIFTATDTDGLDLRFGNDEAMVQAIRRIAYKEGKLGTLLGKGVRQAAEEVGRGSEKYAMHVKGLEVGGYDPRGSRGQALVLACGPRGGCHHAYGVATLVEMPSGTGLQTTGKGNLVRDLARGRILFDSAPICAFVGMRIVPPMLRQLVEAALGIDMPIDKWLEVADRIATLERAYNAREGLRREHDTLPARLLEEPIRSGPNKGQVVSRKELELMKDDFYQSMGWEIKTGLPSAERLRSLQLEDVAEDLQKAGEL